MSIRRKTCETMTLLYEAALKTNPEDDRPPAINPTAGVQHRPALGKAIWKRDTSNPYGGIWVAQDNEEKEDSGLTENSVVIMGDVGKERPPPEMESTDPSIRARAMGRLGRPSGSGDSHGSGSVDHGFGAGFDPALSNGRPPNDIHPRLAHAAPLANTLHIDQQGQTHGPPDDPMQVFRDMQMAGSNVNVNPQMNFAGLDFAGDVSGMANGFADVSFRRLLLESDCLLVSKLPLRGTTRRCSMDSP
jgi:hypothetical protein